MKCRCFLFALRDLIGRRVPFRRRVDPAAERRPFPPPSHPRPQADRRRPPGRRSRSAFFDIP